MCGRYTLYTKKEALEERFHAEMDESFMPNYNASPSQHMPIILNNSPEKIDYGHWGFLPHWAENKKGIKPMINARSESVSEKPFFRNAFHKHRCLVLADGYYEWKNENAKKTPYFIFLKSKEPFAMAGIYEPIEDKHGGIFPSYAIITTEANKKILEIHNRMPVILDQNIEAEWLNSDISIENLQKIISPTNSDLLDFYEIDKAVNSPRNNSPELLNKI